MLNILERNTEELTTLNHSTKVFHDALSNVKKGETRFHVTDSSGSVPDQQFRTSWAILSDTGLIQQIMLIL